MVGIVASRAASREKVAGLINSSKFAIDIPSKLEQLRRLKDELSYADSALLSEFLPPLLDLLTDRFSPVRKSIIEMVGDIGLKHVEFIPETVPILISLLKDGTPAVARQAITCGTNLFRSTLFKVAIQGLFSSELDDSLESSWACVVKLRDEIYTVAFQPESDGRTLMALKFVVAVILLYTPDPSGSPDAPSHKAPEGTSREFNISWLRGGHPILNVGDLSVEASQILGLLLDQIRFPAVKSLSNSMVILLINCLSAIAIQRPAFYGRILPVLLGLDPSSSGNKETCGLMANHALKKAFLTCLKCTHPGAAPWRDRLVGVLREWKARASVEQSLDDVSESNGSMERDDSPSSNQEKKPYISVVKKRLGVHDAGDLAEDGVSGKRIRRTPIPPEEKENVSSKEQDTHVGGLATSRGEVENGPVQQLISMFGALAAQGEKAIASLEILISSISTDLLAEVVMANMRHLPLDRPKAEGNEDPFINMGFSTSTAGYDIHFKYLSSILSEFLSTSSVPTQMDSAPEMPGSSGNDSENSEMDDKQPVVATGRDHGIEQMPAASVADPSADENSIKAFQPEILVVGNTESGIPGLDSASHSDRQADAPNVSSPTPTYLEETNLEKATSLGRSSLELVTSMSTDRSEEISQAATNDVSSITSSTATSVGLSTPLVLPKMLAPVINLADNEKDQLQELVFTRIVDAYKQVAAAGGSHVRFFLLPELGVDFPPELDPWKTLQKHILSDYVNNEGQELTLHVLYKLFGEAEDRDFISSATATTVYEMFLLAVAETLRDSFPASDKSLSRLLGEVPYLPQSIFRLLEGLCSPGSNDKDEKELQSGDRVTQGLSAVWSLILQRPPIRDVCLRIALQSAVHDSEEVRMKAIRLVANRLFPLQSISQQIEDFAKERLYYMKTDDQTNDRVSGEGSEVQKDSILDKPSKENRHMDAGTKDMPPGTSQLFIDQKISPSSLSEAQRCMSLYFALCTKRHSLFREVFAVYKSTTDAVKQAVHHQIPVLVRTIGSSAELLDIISDPPTGTETLLMQVLHTLTDDAIPSPELILTIKRLYDSKIMDVEILVPILSYLPKDEVLTIFPHLVNLPLDKFQSTLAHVMQGSSSSCPVLSPAEVLIAIHGIDPEKDGIPLKKVTDACNACFEQRHIFTQQVLAKVLNQLVEQIPLPLLFMRTVLQAIGAFPALVEFIMEILSRLVNKQIWKNPKLWVGFLKCALLTKPQSFNVLLQLPPAQLENALNRTAALKAPLIAHASQENIRSSLPRSVLAVLGIVSDTQSSGQTQVTSVPTQMPATSGQTGETSNSDKEAVTEKSKETSSAS